MDKKEIKGRTFGSNTVGVLDEDGFWKVILDCTESYTEDGTNWVQEKVEFMSIDRDFNEAHKTALGAYLRWMNDYVYAINSNSLFDGIAYQKSLEANNASEAKDNEAATA